MELGDHYIWTPREKRFGSKILTANARPSHQKLKLFQWPKLFLFLEVDYWWHIPAALSTQPQLSEHSSLPSYKMHLMLLYGLLAGSIGLRAFQQLKGLHPLAGWLVCYMTIQILGKPELGRSSLVILKHTWNFSLNNVFLTLIQFPVPTP